MTWTKLSDDFADDCWTLSDEAFRLHVEGLTWSNRKLLDLLVPKVDVRRFAKHPDATAELVAVGWWTDDGDHYTIRHHADYQRSREDVVKQQSANQANGRKGGRPPGVSREITKPLETHSVSESLSERDRTGQALEEGSSPTAKQNDEPTWPDVVPLRDVRRCRQCHDPLGPDLADELVHPHCRAAS